MINAPIRRWTFALAVAFTATVWVSQPQIRAAQGTFSANPASLGAIPDSPAGGTICGDATGGTRNVTFAVSGLSGAVQAVQVQMSVTHTWVGDIQATLIAPNGATHLLYSQTGATTPDGCGDNSNLVGPYVFRDGVASSWWAAAAAADAATALPSTVYNTSTAGGEVGGGAATSIDAAFAGVANANGTWTLQFRDLGEGDTGSVGAAEITITTGSGQRAPVDFTGDNRTDLAVARNGGASGITWYWMSPNGTGFGADVWGIAATDFLAPSDYDGDGKTDVAVWRPGAPGVFYIHRSSNLSVMTTPFGQTGDDPSVVGDYDGDGKADPAVFRHGLNPGPAPAFWYFWKSTTASLGGVQWGQDGDFPSPGDYDGDGKYDFAVQRQATPTQGVFYILHATGSSQTIFWGLPTDFIVPGDYDGDGKTDIAVGRSASGVLHWHIRRSSDGGHTFYAFGASGDVRAQGDYDGDGRTDPAIWRPSGASSFYALFSSTSATFGAQFGQVNDYPVANFNVH
jgi:subtilisin-like proprotein convertase family protein